MVFLFLFLLFLSADFGGTTSISVNCHEYHLNLPQNFMIFSAKYSPDGSKMLISGAVYDSSVYFWPKFSFFLVNSVNTNAIYKTIYYLTEFLCPPVHRKIFRGFTDIFSFDSHNLRVWNDVHWLTENTLIFDGEIPHWSGPARGNSYYIFNFSISLRETTRVCLEQETPIFDVSGNNILVGNCPEEWYFISDGDNSGGVFSLYQINIGYDSKPQKTVRLTRIDPDTSFVFSQIIGARYLSNNRVIYQKFFKVKKEKDIIVRSFELLDLSSGEVLILKRFDKHGKGYFPGFDVSPDEKWLIFSSSTGCLKLLSLEDQNITELSLFLSEPGGVTPELLDYKNYSFGALDWVPQGKQILCQGMRKKTGETKLYIIVCLSA